MRASSRTDGTGTVGVRRRALVALTALALLTGLAVAVPTGTPPGAGAVTAPPLGTNLGAVTYYDGLVPFANLVDQAGDWIPQVNGGSWGSGPALTLRRDGWPASFSTGQYATAVLAEIRYPAGTYSVSWQGKGTFDVNGTAFGSTSVAGGTGTVTLDGSEIVLLNLRTTVTSDPLRAIAVRVPGAAPDAVFRSAYLAQLAPYSAVRFMDWQRTNSTFADPARTFTCDNRTLPGSYSQGTRLGVSVERMVLLANSVGADPWFTIPHEATDAWITCHAQVVAAELAPGLTPRYEFSNETWNPQFTAFHELQQEGVDLGLGAGDPYLALQQRHAQRHSAAMNLVSTVFTAAGRSVVRVLAGQAANTWVLAERLKPTGAAATTDEIAIAPYLHVHGRNAFDPTDAAVIAGWTQSQLFANLATAQTAEVDVWTADHVALAATAGKTLVAYEAGQHLAGDTGNNALTTLFTGANRAAAMGTAYRTYLDHWRTATNGALLMHFTDAGPYTRYGSWGALEYPEQATSPKYAALVDYANGTTTTTTTSTSSSTTTTTVPPAPTALRFTAVNPTRILDSRAGSAIGDFTTAWGAGTVRDVQVTGRGGVPIGAAVVVLNLTGVAPSAPSAISVWPTGQVRPAASALRLAAGITLANAVTVPLGLGGKVRIANDAGSVDLLADVAGYFTATGAGFTTITPKRFIDSRPATKVGGYSTPWGAGTTRGITIGGKNGVPRDATAVVLTVTAVNPTAASFLEVWPNGIARPPALSALNFPAGRTTANQVTARLGTNGAIQVFNLAGTTDVTIDVVGYYRSGSGAAFTPLPFTRILDSRSATTIGGYTTPWGAGTTRTVQFSGRGGIPAGALAATGNFVTLESTAVSSLVAGPAGTALPLITTTAFPAGSANAGAFTVKLPSGGAASVRNATGSTHVLADVTGYFR